MQGHTLRYKLDDGTWVDIPIALIDVYDTYALYCANNNITPVDKTTYYQTLGNLKKLVTELTGSTEAIEALSQAIGRGALPVEKGGTGCTNLDTFVQTLQTKLSAIGFTEEQIESITNIITTDTTVSSKLNKTDITVGTEPPDEDTPGLYYFQYKE